ncbi:hypothetical protein IRV22_15490 [Bacillus cereus]|uniref:hypothetical protein n=1 Tax=Bacillus cereus TaxID=1396 RepID=UPI001927A72A|nr:hypothetical protein [Bacillus cereus]MBL3889122.1 hypothetical protein [Bacillus cereus]
MINILTVEEQIKTAIDLYHIERDDNISDEQAQKAYTLYTGLHRKPKYINEIEEIPSSSCFFKEPINIISLRQWVLNVLPYIDLLSETGKLPLTRTINDFEGYINDVFENYLSAFNNINRLIPLEYRGIKDNIFNKTKDMCEKIKGAIRLYYNGFPAEAFFELREGLNINIAITGHFDNNTILSDANKQVFYKMRVGTHHSFLKEEMFHIPFELRGKVSTNRYSLPGIPCVYLGISALSCWEELNKPDLKTIQTSMFESDKIKYLDLSLPPAVFIEDLTRDYSKRAVNGLVYDIISYIMFWPLMAACSIRVKNKDDIFKPEYIIPQLLLQYIRQSESIDGISYFSTKIDNYTEETYEIYRNFAFPVQGNEKTGLCSILKEKFVVTDAVPWQTFELYKDSEFCQPENSDENKQYKIEFIDGMKLSYTSTNFYKLENFLKSKSVIEKA